MKRFFDSRIGLVTASAIVLCTAARHTDARPIVGATIGGEPQRSTAPAPKRQRNDRTPIIPRQTDPGERTGKSEGKHKLEKSTVYIGTYTGGDSKGIYIYRLDLTSGELTPDGAAPFVESPSFLAVDSSHHYLYAVNESASVGPEHAGLVSAFAIAPKTGALKLLNQESSRGSGPCHISIDSHAKHVLVANYNSGSIAVLPILIGGKLGPATSFVQHTGSSVDPERQKEPHAHSIYPDPNNHFVLSADLGIDKVLVYRYDAAKGTISPDDPPFAAVAPGSGPRHIAFHPNGHFVYVVNEMFSSVTAFTYDASKGTLKDIQTVPALPTDFKGVDTAAEIAVHPNGKFLYSSNRGSDTIAIFTIDTQTGKITPAGHQSTQGKGPRHFIIDPTGIYLIAANQDSDNVVVFRIDERTGALTPTGHSITLPKPVCVIVLPAGK